jgi:UDP-glucose:(heptosyl)LPS alpha-1,3-glucosyltransferase
MRIAFLSRHFDPQGGGAERYSVAVAQELAQRHDVHVFAQTFGAAPAQGWTPHKIPGPLRRPRWVNQLWFAVATAWLTHRGFDVVYSHEHSWHGNVQCFHVLPIRHSLLINRHGWRRVGRTLKILTSPRLLAYWWLEGARLKGVHTGQRAVLAVSEPLRRTLEQTYPAAQGHVSVITPGVVAASPKSAQDQHRARLALGLPLDDRLALLVANDPLRKGLKTLIQALAQLPPTWKLVIAGHIPPASAYRALAEEAGVLERLLFLGPQRDLRLAYHAADVLAHPTLEDTYGMVVLEAMANGLPVVVSGLPYCGISAELSPGTQAVVLQDPTDPQALAKALQSLVDQPERMLQLAAGGHAWAQQKTWAQCARAHEAVFAQVTSNRR